MAGIETTLAESLIHVIQGEFTFIINSDLNATFYTSISIDLFNSALLSKCPQWQDNKGYLV